MYEIIRQMILNPESKWSYGTGYTADMEDDWFAVRLENQSYPQKFHSVSAVFCVDGAHSCRARSDCPDWVLQVWGQEPNYEDGQSDSTVMWEAFGLPWILV